MGWVEGLSFLSKKKREILWSCCDSSWNECCLIKTDEAKTSKHTLQVDSLSEWEMISCFDRLKENERDRESTKRIANCHGISIIDTPNNSHKLFANKCAACVLVYVGKYIDVCMCVNMNWCKDIYYYSTSVANGLFRMFMIERIDENLSKYYWRNFIERVKCVGVDTITLLSRRLQHDVWFQKIQNIWQKFAKTQQISAETIIEKRGEGGRQRRQYTREWYFLIIRTHTHDAQCFATLQR